MKKTLLLLVFVIMAVALVACGANTNGDKSVHDDLLNYGNVELKKLTSLETSVGQTYESVSGENYSDDSTMLAALEDKIIPESEELVEAAENLDIESKEVQDVHDIYISATRDQHQSFETMVEALKNQNPDQITEANEKMDSARSKSADYLDELKSLAEENNVNFDIE